MLTVTRIQDDPAFTYTEYAARLTFAQVPSEVSTVLKQMVLDTLGATLAGSTLGSGIQVLMTVVRAAGGTPESTVVGWGDRTSAPMAALANGAMAHALNYDDVFPGGGHLGVVTIPTAWAIAERRGQITGQQLLAALAAGAELMARLQLAIPKGEDSSEAHPQPTQLLGVFAAAVSASYLLGLDAAGMLSALGMALMQANGHRQPVLEGTPAKAIYAGFPNLGGVLSALFAEAGLGARCAVFSGEAGLFATCYGGHAHPEVLVDGLGERYELLRVGFKPWSTTGHAHPFIQAAQELAIEYDLRPADIQAVRLIGGPQIRTFAEPLQTRRHPESSVEGEDSIFFGPAKMLANRRLTLADFQSPGLYQAESSAIADRMDYAIDASIGRAGVVEVTTTSGRILTRRIDHAPGEPSNPLSYDQLVEKFLDCATHSATPLQRDVLDQVIDLVDHLEAVPDVSALSRLLGGQG